jgi:hypothetical protein
VQVTAPTQTDSRRYLRMKMARFGIILLNKHGRILECERCETQWRPEPAADGRLPEGFWRCPNRCNW